MKRLGGGICFVQYADGSLYIQVGRKKIPCATNRFCNTEAIRGPTTTIALEDRLIEDLGRSAQMAGRDCGSGETNMFIFTSDPAATLWRARRTLKKEGRLEAVTAAYRQVDGERYAVLWPESSPQEFTVT